jgi:hypothetical protein
MTTTFPLIEPNRRGYSFPDYPVGEASEWAGVTMLREQQLPVDQALTPGAPVVIDYEDITYADVRRIRLHWAATLHGAKAFAGNALIWPQEDGRRFRYTSRPQEQQKKGGLYDVRVELEIDAVATYVGATAFAPRSTNVTRAELTTIVGVGVSVIVPSSGATIVVALLPTVSTGGPAVAIPAAKLVANGVPTGTVLTAYAVHPTSAVKIRTPLPNVTVTPGGVLDTSATNTSFMRGGPAPTIVIGVGRDIPAAAILSRGRAPTITVGGGGGLVFPPAPKAVLTGLVPASVAARSAPPTPITATYAQSGIGAESLAADAASMTNGFLGETQKTRATGSAGNTWVRLDMGAPTAFGRVVIGTVYLTIPGGWGPNFLEDASIQGSNNATTWTTIRPSIGAQQESFATLQEYETPGQTWRYVRILGQFTSVPISEFYVAV